MATTSIVVPAHGSSQEHRCVRHKLPRYYQLEWEHHTTSIKDVIDVLNGALPHKHHAFSFVAPVYSSERAAYPFQLYWDEAQGMWQHRTLIILVDVGVTTDCNGLSCTPFQFDISLDGKMPHIHGFRTSGDRFYDIEGILTEDWETSFSRVYRAQVEWEACATETFGQPIVRNDSI